MNITCMDPKIYNAAAEGNIMVFKDEPLEALLTPNKNTVLHIFIKTLKNGEESAKTNFVGEILNMRPSLLCQVNVKDETPLHVAARYGHANIVQVLIEKARDPFHQDVESGTKAVRKMLRMVNNERDIALHEAVRYNHLEVMKLLIKEDPDSSYIVNNARETPLYIATERNYRNLVLEILNTCNLLAYDGPIGRTALHAAVLWDNEGTIKEILNRVGGAITKKADQEGWTPLHLAAYTDGWLSTKLLLEHDSQVAYMQDKVGRTALHIAAQRGNYQIMKSIIDMCPDCCELVDNRGWNALHFAVGGKFSLFDVKEILKNSSLINLLNEKDADGNTPLHHHSRSLDYVLIQNLMDHPRVDKMAFNKNNLNAYQVTLTSANISKEEATKIPSKLWSRSQRLFIKGKEFDLDEFLENRDKKDDKDIEEEEKNRDIEDVENDKDASRDEVKEQD